MKGRQVDEGREKRGLETDEREWQRNLLALQFNGQKISKGENSEIELRLNEIEKLPPNAIQFSVLAPSKFPEPPLLLKNKSSFLKGKGFHWIALNACISTGKPPIFWS